jgi:hypothetical protein
MDSYCGMLLFKRTRSDWMSAVGLWKRKSGKNNRILKTKECGLEDRRSEVYPKKCLAESAEYSL